MIAYLTDFFRDQPVLVFFLVLSLGYLVGSIRVAGISLGSVGGVLLVGLLFGHLGFTMHAGAQTFGFAIFIFCVGYQAGPQFFDVLMSDGLKYLSLALVAATTGFALAAGLAGWMGLAPGLAAGPQQSHSKKRCSHANPVFWWRPQFELSLPYVVSGWCIHHQRR